MLLQEDLRLTSPTNILGGGAVHPGMGQAVQAYAAGGRPPRGPRQGDEQLGATFTKAQQVQLRQQIMAMKLLLSGSAVPKVTLTQATAPPNEQEEEESGWMGRMYRTTAAPRGGAGRGGGRGRGRGQYVC